MFSVHFLQNGASNRKILLHLFDLFFHAESRTYPFFALYISSLFKNDHNSIYDPVYHLITISSYAELKSVSSHTFDIPLEFIYTPYRVNL